MDSIKNINAFTQENAELLGLFSMKNTRDGIKKICDNQMRLIKLALSTKNEEEKRVYSVEEIQKILDISKTTAYELVRKAPFRVIHVGNAIRISKIDFDRWLDRQG